MIDTTSTKRLVILGSGGYGRTLIDLAEQLGYKDIITLDDKDPEHPLASFVDYISGDPDNLVEFIPAFGNNEFRLSWCERIQATPGAQLATLIHPSAYISPKATVAPGTVILPHSVINTGTVVKRGCIVNIGSLIDHDCVLESGVHLAPGSIVKGENRIPRGCKIESGEVVERGQFPL